MSIKLNYSRVFAGPAVFAAAMLINDFSSQKAVAQITGGGSGASISAAPAGGAGSAATGDAMAGANGGGGVGFSGAGDNAGGAGGRSYFNNKSLDRMNDMMRRNGYKPAPSGNSSDSAYLNYRYGSAASPATTPDPAPNPNPSPNQNTYNPYGYYGNQSPFFYNYYNYNPYYSNEFPTAVPGAVGASNYFQYRDSNNDGFFDQYNSYGSLSSDNVPSRYERYEMALQQQQAAMIESRRQAIQEEAKDAERQASLEARKGQGVTVSGGVKPEDEKETLMESAPRLPRRRVNGVIAKTMMSMANGREDVIAQVRNDDGQTSIVDLGPATTPALAKVSAGAEIASTGFVEKIGEREVMIADQLSVNGVDVKINRLDEVKQGKLVDFERVEVKETEHTLGLIDIGGEKQLVDLGSRTPVELGLSKGIDIAVKAVPVQLDHRNLLMVHEAIIDGNRMTIER